MNIYLPLKFNIIWLQAVTIVQDNSTYKTYCPLMVTKTNIYIESQCFNNLRPRLQTI